MVSKCIFIQATDQEMPPTTRSWKRQRTESPLLPSEGIRHFQHFGVGLVIPILDFWPPKIHSANLLARATIHQARQHSRANNYPTREQMRATIHWAREQARANIYPAWEQARVTIHPSNLQARETIQKKKKKLF